jgi:hypothetical protein
MTARDPRIAYGIIVFGRGHAPGRVDRLSDASLARVERLGEYLAQHAGEFAARRATVVCSGGWAGAAGAVVQRPADEQCEGNLMASAARALSVRGVPLTQYAEVSAEIESASTLENAIRVHTGGFFDTMRFDERSPLGLVAHPGHVERAAYYCRKVFGLSRSSMLPIVATGGDQLSADLPEPLMNLATRLACAGRRRALDQTHLHQVMQRVPDRRYRGAEGPGHDRRGDRTPWPAAEEVQDPQRPHARIPALAQHAHARKDRAAHRDVLDRQFIEPPLRLRLPKRGGEGPQARTVRVHQTRGDDAHRERKAFAMLEHTGELRQRVDLGGVTGTGPVHGLDEFDGLPSGLSIRKSSCLCGAG